jgi:hypothetical protein
MLGSYYSFPTDRVRARDALLLLLTSVGPSLPLLLDRLVLEAIRK